MADDVLDELTDELLASGAGPSNNPPSNELWPMVNARVSTFTAGGSNRFYTGTAGPAGLNLVAAFDPRFSGSGRFPAGILRALLYSHGLVIEDPVLLAAEFHQQSVAAVRHMTRSAVIAGIESISEVSALIDAGVVETFFTPMTAQADANAVAETLLAIIDARSGGFDEGAVWDAFEAGFVDGLEPELQVLWKQIRAGDRSPPLELVAEAASKDAEVVETFIKVVAELRPRGVIENAVDVVARALADIARHGGTFDLLCPSRLFAQLAFAAAPDPAQAVRLHQLAEVEVPRLDDLLIEDAVAIRAGDESLALWRSHLSIGLDRARHLEEELGSTIDAAAVVGEELATARAALLSESRRSSWFGERGGMMTFIAGALGGAIGGTTSGAAGAALGALGGSLPGLLGAAPRRAPGYLERHYLLFER